jgi:hypothetical protein
VTDSREVQELKQSKEMISTEEGMEIDLSEEQYINALLSHDRSM